MKLIYIKSPYNGEDNIVTRPLISPGEIPSARNRLHLVG